MRIALFHTELSRDGPGLMLRDILAGDDPQVTAIAEVTGHLDADILVLAGIDWDAGGLGLRALSDQLGYPHALTARPNRGLPSGHDLDGDGRRGEPEDAVGFGDFTGQSAMAVLSRLPLDLAADLTSTPWSEVENALGPPDPVFRMLPVSTTSHWRITVATDPPLTLLAWHATPPVFDGPEDFNGRRNHDEAALWLPVIETVAAPMVVAGFANLDPLDGDGRPDALLRLLDHPRLVDPEPASTGGLRAAERQAGANRSHLGDPALDTADWRDEGRGPGNLRVDFLLPSRDLRVIASGVLWPVEGDPLAVAVETASRHRAVWLDLGLPAPP